MYKHILVATDGSKLSQKAVKAAAKLARALGARLTGINVMPEYEDCSELAREADVPLIAVQSAAYSAFEEQKVSFQKMIEEGLIDEE